MNKEQFKKSISEMINYFVGSMIDFNLRADAAMRDKNTALVNMMQGQAQGLAMTFEKELDNLISEVFPDEEVKEDIDGKVE